MFCSFTPSRTRKPCRRGLGVRRHDVMYNDFVIVGSIDDPARVAGSKDAASALRRIAETKSAFVSRGDDSGTHKAELALWRDAGIDPRGASGTWYREAGLAWGDAQHGASHARLRADRSGDVGLLRQQGRPRHTVSGDPKLFNQYGVILVNPARHPRAKAQEGQAFIDWLIGPDGQAAIADFRVGGEQVFFPNARSAL